MWKLKRVKKIALRTFILFFTLASVNSYFSGHPLAAAEDLSAPKTQDAFDAMFVLDTSYSMNKTDPGHMAGEVMNMFMDMSEASRTRVGYVAFNHSIVASKPLTDISVASKKNDLRQGIAKLKRSGYTDLGLGLITGGNLLSKSLKGKAQEERQPFMILLSDGETDFGPSGSGHRTAANSAKDVERAIQQAKTYHYPIYTIGLNHDGTVNPAELNRIAVETGGRSYITSSADDLPEIFNRIFADQIRSVLTPVAGVTATGQLQEISIDIPNSSMEEANIILLSEHALKEAQLFYSSDNIRLFKSSTYTLIKSSHPGKGTAKLKFRGSPGDLVKINLLGSYSFEADSAVQGKAIKGKPTRIQTSLTSMGKSLQDKDVYTSLQAKLIVRNVKTKKEDSVDMSNKGDHFEADYVFSESTDYEWYVNMEGPSFYRISSTHHQPIVNTAPRFKGQQELKLVREEGEQQWNLSDLFTDENGDKLTYSIQDAGSDSKLQAAITGDQLVLSPHKNGSATLHLTATDAEGGQVSAAITISISSKYTVLIWSGIGVIILAAIGFLMYLWLRPKPSFTGKLEGYFLNTASGTEYPVKSWPLTSFSGRRITLQELFHSLDVHEPLPEAASILFEPGKRGTLTVKHATRCSLMRNRTPLPKNKKEILEYNDKLYITFEDGITEIELRYKAIKPSTNIFIRSGASSEEKIS